MQIAPTAVIQGSAVGSVVVRRLGAVGAKYVGGNLVTDCAQSEFLPSFTASLAFLHNLNIHRGCFQALGTLPTDETFHLILPVLYMLVSRSYS